MKDSHLRKVPSKEHTPLKEGNMDVTLSQHDSSRYVHNQAYQGGDKSLLNVNVIFLQSESSVKLLTQIKLIDTENSPQNLLTFKPRIRSRQSSCLSEDKLPMETEELYKRFLL